MQGQRRLTDSGHSADGADQHSLCLPPLFVQQREGLLEFGAAAGEHRQISRELGQSPRSRSRLDRGQQPGPILFVQVEAVGQRLGGAALG
ncbi:hypothetical protein GCM10020220_103840 [Nonomuraea rubra]|uniref:hypothetical protein n=1 Tax=Nonomuraea rubra TaxID=46180 RepID=UPI0031F1285A